MPCRAKHLLSIFDQFSVYGLVFALNFISRVNHLIHQTNLINLIPFPKFDVRQALALLCAKMNPLSLIITIIKRIRRVPRIVTTRERGHHPVLPANYFIRVAGGALCHLNLSGVTSAG